MRCWLSLIWKQTAIIKTILRLAKLTVNVFGPALCMTIKLAEIYENVKQIPLFSKLLHTRPLAREAKCATVSRNGLHSTERVWVRELVGELPSKYEEAVDEQV
jgi:hypothetical protein